MERDLRMADAPDLRMIHVRKLGQEFYFLVNEESGGDCR